MIRNYAILFLFFIVALVIRWPHLNRPLSKHHEFNAANILICVETWNANGGPSYTHGATILNYTNQGDLFLDLQRYHVIDAKGNQIYVSFGVGQYVLAWTYFKLTGLPVTPLSLQILALLLGLICTVQVFFIMKKILPGNLANTDSIALFAAFIFLLNPAVLWYFSNGYMHEMVVMPFLLGAFSFFIDFITNDKIQTRKLIFFGILIAAGIFCDWISVFFAGIAFLYACIKWRNEKKWTSFLVITMCAVIAGISFAMLPFILHIGFKKYIDTLQLRFTERGIAAGSGGAALHHLFKILINYLTSYASLFLGMAVLYLLNLKQWRFRIAEAVKQIPVSLRIMLIVILLHHVVFPEFSSRHEYSVLKASFSLALLFGLMMQNMPVKKMYIAAFLFFAASIAQFYYINRLGKVSFNGDRYEVSQKTGEIIRSYAQPDEAVFVNDNDMYTQMNFYAKRITINAFTLAEAKAKLVSQTKNKKGVWFDIRQGEFAGIYRFTAP